MSEQSSRVRVRACVLAAGSSSRYGKTKLTEDLNGRALLQHALLAAQAVCEGSVTLVVGGDEQNVAAAAGNLCDRIVLNHRYQQGIGTSIATGVNALQDEADAVLLLLADQPLISADHLRDICTTWSGAATEIVATSFDGVTCPPVLFPRGTFSTLCALSDDMGARSVLSDNRFSLQAINFDPARIDVDTPEDLESLRRG